MTKLFENSQMKQIHEEDMSTTNPTRKKMEVILMKKQKKQKKTASSFPEMNLYLINVCPAFKKMLQCSACELQIVF